MGLGGVGLLGVILILGCSVIWGRIAEVDMGALEIESRRKKLRTLVNLLFLTGRVLGGDGGAF